MTRPTATPNRLIPLDDSDPRLALDDRSLVEASRNAFPVVASPRQRKDTFGLAAGGAIALLLGGLTLWSMSAHRTTPAPAPVPVVAPAPLPSPAQPPVLAAAPVQSLMMPSVPPAAITTVPQAGPSPALIFDTSTTPATATAPTGVAPATGAPSPRVANGPPGSENDQFASRVGDSEVQVATAQSMANPAQTVTQGTLIPAVLETAINTDLPGYVRALVSRDVRSFDSSQVLIPRSSRLIGQYKSGLTAGQTRAYVIWTRLIRPDGASVALASPGVDLAGNSGLAGQVDGHFMKRFGSAILLSVVSGLTAAGNASVVLAGGQSAATVAAQSDTVIPPTVKVAQGQPIRIFTARDLDFSTVAPVAAAQ